MDDGDKRHMLTAPQLRAARGLLGLSQAQTADAARVGLSTVKNFELGKSTPIENNLSAIRKALEAAGVEFIAENGGGVGVRLRKGRDAGSTPVKHLTSQNDK